MHFWRCCGASKVRVLNAAREKVNFTFAKKKKKRYKIMETTDSTTPLEPPLSYSCTGALKQICLKMTIFK